MFEAFITTTASTGLQPLGTAAQRSYELVSDSLRTRLGPAYAELLAEPVPTQYGDSYDWYAPIIGTSIALDTLDPAQQDELRGKVARMSDHIREDAQKLGQSTDPNDQRLSEALLNAIEVPDARSIFAIQTESDGLRPVLVNWAWIRDEHLSVRGVLTGLGRRRTVAPAPHAGAIAGSQPAPVVADVDFTQKSFWLRHWWLLLLGWLLLLALLGWILYLLIAPCGLRDGRLLFCPAVAVADSVTVIERSTIEDEILGLERRLALADRSCQPQAPVPITLPPIPAAPQEPQQSEESAEIDRRLDDRGAQQGALSFSLAWNNRDDLDLHITCPAGATLNYRDRNACNGQLDIDANASSTNAINDPIENVYFTNATPGSYRVRVHLFSTRTNRSTPFTLRIRDENGQEDILRGSVSPSSNTWTHTFTIGE